MEERKGLAEHTAAVLASGGLGLVYLQGYDHRPSLAEIESLHPRLVDALVEHPGIGFVMVRAAEGDGGIVLGSGGSRRLRDDLVSGEDPLRDFGPNAADHVRRTDGFPHCPDILVNCMFDADANEVAPFEDFMGSHGGLGGWQTRPFALVPSGWSEEPGELVGAEAMHDALRGWLAELGQELEPHAGRAD